MFIIFQATFTFAQFLFRMSVWICIHTVAALRHASQMIYGESEKDGFYFCYSMELQTRMSMTLSCQKILLKINDFGIYVFRMNYFLFTIDFLEQFSGNLFFINVFCKQNKQDKRID